MSASLLSRTLGTIAENYRFTALACTESVRFASKKSSGSSNNKRKVTPGKHRGWKKYDGDYVEKGMILYRQLGHKVYPGENVGIGKDKTLFALEAGRVMITKEKLSPHPHSPLYPLVESGREFYRPFFHVIPDKQENRFKLVSQT